MGKLLLLIFSRFIFQHLGKSSLSLCGSLCVALSVWLSLCGSLCVALSVWLSLCGLRILRILRIQGWTW
jgi:hypothetical protein